MKIDKDAKNTRFVIKVYLTLEVKNYCPAIINETSFVKVEVGVATTKRRKSVKTI